MCNESVALHLLRPHDTLVAQARRTPRPWTQLGRPAPAQDPCPTPRNPRSDPSVTHIHASRPPIQSAASPQDVHEAPTSANVAHAYTCRSVPLTHSSQRRQAQRGEFWIIIITTTSSGGTEEISEVFALVTTLLDPDSAPAADLAELYHLRWQAETGIADLKTTQRGGPEIVLRSKSPVMVAQEFWAMLCVYQAVRDVITYAAPSGLDPGRISFTKTITIHRLPTPRSP